MQLKTVVAFRWLGLGVGVMFVVLGLVARIQPPEEREPSLQYEWQTRADGTVVLSDYRDTPDGPHPVVVFEGSAAEAEAWVAEQEATRAETEEPAEQREVLPNSLMAIGVVSVLLGGLLHRLEGTPRRLAFAYVGGLSGAAPGVVLLAIFSYSSLNTSDSAYWQEVLWMAAGALMLVGAILGLQHGISAGKQSTDQPITIP